MPSAARDRVHHDLEGQVAPQALQGKTAEDGQVDQPPIAQIHNGATVLPRVRVPRPQVGELAADGRDFGAIQDSRPMRPMDHYVRVLVVLQPDVLAHGAVDGCPGRAELQQQLGHPAGRACQGHPPRDLDANEDIALLERLPRRELQQYAALHVPVVEREALGPLLRRGAREERHTAGRAAVREGGLPDVPQGARRGAVHREVEASPGAGQRSLVVR
mmetsp:Transcript_54093/g.167710  ORF Transcript_54093/g.167710 Transcript_54093/m.167710 type:complete len:217 (+) Transcript_54093:98-748(+)